MTSIINQIPAYLKLTKQNKIIQMMKISLQFTQMRAVTL